MRTEHYVVHLSAVPGEVQSATAACGAYAESLAVEAMTAQLGPYWSKVDMGRVTLTSYHYEVGLDEYHRGVRAVVTIDRSKAAEIFVSDVDFVHLDGTVRLVVSTWR